MFGIPTPFKNKDLYSAKTRINPLVIMLVVIFTVYGVYWFSTSSKTRNLDRQIKASMEAPAGKIFSALMTDSTANYKEKISLNNSLIIINYWKNKQLLAFRSSNVLELPLPDTAYHSIWKNHPDSATFKVILNTQDSLIALDTIYGSVIRQGGKWSKAMVK